MSHMAQSHLLLLPEACTAVEHAQIRFEQRSSIRSAGKSKAELPCWQGATLSPRDLACSAARSNSDSCYFVPQTC